MKTTTIHAAVYRAALLKLDECRDAIPGIGGDIDAANLRALIRRGETCRSTSDQAANTLEYLSRAITEHGHAIDAESEVLALRSVTMMDAAPKLYSALKMTPLGRHAADERGPCFCSQCEFRREAERAIAAAEGTP